MSIKYDPKVFNEEYYQSMSITDKFDLLIPLKKAFKKSYSLLPIGTSVTAFGFEYYKRLDKLKTVFDEVYGYDINPYAVKEAEENGYKGCVSLTDVTIPMEKITPTVLSICFYVIEHLTELQVYNLLLNMKKTSPMHFIVITDNEDPRYTEDNTHINSKTSNEWSICLGAFYKSMKWKRVYRKYSKFLFVDPEIYDLQNAMVADINSHLQSKYIEELFT